ncbi:abscission/NoCut checkpoint regulator [Lingula anatina]|uniref:Abscission/NoCut checkpoint regulator n=1 Tax=Lingula anatina TaxID=7574 RepID=A0A1S3IXT6_LINAN|nr:abscission/NoCut checkpoint regulator [Lingula anatina]|eukprot:XP_013402843.1 abscission/NoCut checkpoint regulator [Lingula anatina]
MSGKCYSCATEFGIFKKEHGCKNCGFGFCSKCVSSKIAVPKRNSEVHHVCQKCYDILSGKRQEDTDTSKYSPPAALKKRMAALDNPETGTTHSRQQSAAKPVASSKSHKGMSKEDIEIARRLEKLREKPKDVPPVPDEQAVAARLAKLRGQDPSNMTKAPNTKFYQAPDTRTAAKQTEDLLDEICAEIDLDSKYPTPEQDIHNRLLQLHQQPGKQNEESVAKNSRSSSMGQNDLNKQDSMPEKLYRKNINLPMEEENQTNSTEKNDIDIQEMQRLIAEAAHELELDAQKAIKDLERDKDIQERLAQLKRDRKKNENKEKENKEVLEGATCIVSGDDNVESEEDEEESIKKILKKALEENRLDDELEESGYKECIKERTKRKTKTEKGEQKYGYNDDDEEEEEEDSDDLPWCCICNADASLRCYGCDGDLYCDRCFKEGHDTFAMTDHKPTKFKPKKKTEQQEIEEL